MNTFQWLWHEYAISWGEPSPWWRQVWAVIGSVGFAFTLFCWFCARTDFRRKPDDTTNASALWFCTLLLLFMPVWPIAAAVVGLYYFVRYLRFLPGALWSAAKWPFGVVSRSVSDVNRARVLSRD